MSDDKQSTQNNPHSISPDASSQQEILSILEESEMLFRTLVNSMDDVIFVLDRDHRHVQVPGRWIKNAGLTPEFFLGKTSREILGEEAAKIHEVSTTRALKGETVRYEWHTINPDGSMAYFETVLSPLFDQNDNVIGIIGVGRDITDNKQAEQKRLQIRMEEERIQILSSFIDQVSHEFRTPLASVNLNTHLIKKTSGDDRLDKYLDKINQQVETITDLVDSMKLMALLDSIRQINYQPFNLSGVIDALVDTYKSEAQAKNIDLCVKHAETDTRMQGDHILIQRMLSAILDNAVQFTPENGSIRIETLLHTNAVHIIMVDTGIGISADSLDLIFDRFYRANEASTVRGFGLGLPIAKSIAELHQGRIEVSSTPGEGTRVEVILNTDPSAA